MSQKKALATLVRMCSSTQVTDSERVVQAWLYVEKEEALCQGIGLLTANLPRKAIQTLTASATNVLSKMQEDELGIGFGVDINPQLVPNDFVPREFIIELAAMRVAS